MSLAGPPVRFLFTVVTLWASGRTALVMWDAAQLAPVMRETEWVAADPVRPAAPQLQAASLRSESQTDKPLRLAMMPAAVPATPSPRRAVRAAVPDGPVAESGFDGVSLLVMASYGGPPMPQRPGAAADATTALPTRTAAPVLATAALSFDPLMTATAPAVLAPSAATPGESGRSIALIVDDVRSRV